MAQKTLDVFGTLKKYILVDGYEILVDLDASHGSWIVDKKTNDEYLDFYSFFASAPVGFNHPDALEDQEFLKNLQSAAINKVSNSDFYTEQYAQFLDTFARVAIPSKFKHAFFISGGALAVENTMKASFDWKVRKNFANGMNTEKGSQILHFKEAFHGRTGYTLSVTNTADPRKYQYFPQFDWPRVHNPKITFPLEDHLDHVKASEQESYKQILQAFDERKDDIAAIIIEPIQGEGGDNHFRKEFFQELRKIADEKEAMLIFDEVQTGIGMTGEMWGYQANGGIVPDMLAFGKKMQTCGFLSTDRIDSVENNVFEESSRINSTWGGNLVDFVRSTKYLEIIEKHKLVSHAKNLGQYMQNQLQSIADESNGLISGVRGKGFFIAFDLPDTKTRDEIKQKMYENKVLVLSSGHKSIRFRPPLTISKEEIDLGLQRLIEVIN